jgi:predicted ATP-grasp superfamily ATP-dependent carboligase
LAAGNRYTLIERFIGAAAHFGLDLRLVSFEKFDTQPPILDLIPINFELNFSAPEFKTKLKSLIDKNSIDLLIPMHDAFFSSDCFLVSKEIMTTPDAQMLSDKIKLKKVSTDLDIPSASDTPGLFPKIIKPREGYGSRDIKVVYAEHEIKSYDSSNYLIEDHISGSEASVDVYFSRFDKRFCAIGRDRLRIEGGEVAHSVTRELTRIERETISKLNHKFELVGPYNFQFIGEEELLMEINPRFGGGATISMSAGWNAVHWIMEEYLIGKPFVEPSKFSHVEGIRSRRDHIRSRNE